MASTQRFQLCTSSLCFLDLVVKQMCLQVNSGLTLMWLMNFNSVIDYIVGHSDSPLVAENPCGRVATPMP